MEKLKWLHTPEWGLVQTLEHFLWIWVRQLQYYWHPSSVSVKAMLFLKSLLQTVWKNTDYVHIFEIQLQTFEELDLLRLLKSTFSFLISIPYFCPICSNSFSAAVTIICVVSHLAYLFLKSVQTADGDEYFPLNSLPVNYLPVPWYSNHTSWHGHSWVITVFLQNSKLCCFLKNMLLIISIVWNW